MSINPVSEQDVIEYLNSNLDFFIKNPQLLEEIQVSNKNGKLASLSSHQTNTLKDRNSQLKTRLADLIQLASDNERIMSMVFEVALEVGKYSKVSNVAKCFVHHVRKHFSPDWVKMILPANSKLNEVNEVIQVKEASGILLIFEDVITTKKAVCGRLRKNILEFLLSTEASEVGSSILLPIGANGEKGIVFFGSKDEDRFHPDMSADLLMRLSQILDSKFKAGFDFSIDSSLKTQE